MRTCTLLISFAIALLSTLAQASVGLTEIESETSSGPVTVFYPSSSDAGGIERDRFALDVAWQGTPVRGNGRLVVISHGSTGSPWVHADLARSLVDAGFVVAFPEHQADNYKDGSAPGPASWKRRPAEVSQAIDAVAHAPQFASLLSLDKVGMFGMSAGGHTALTLAGGRWSPAQLKRHCDTSIAEDFQACAGLTTRLDGGMFDGLKIRITQWVIGVKLNDPAWYNHTDPRISAVVAGVPFAADFDPASLAAPRVSLGMVTARKDEWLVPRFHSEVILQACSTCERIADLDEGGHGSLLSPLPPGRSGLLAALIDDPPGFDRAREVPEVNRKIVSFFLKQLAPQVLPSR